MRNKKCCLNCAFLHEPESKVEPLPSADHELRAKLASGEAVAAIVQCHKGVWGPEALVSVPSEEFMEYLRIGCPFFFQWRTDRDRCCVADKLQRLEEKRRTDWMMLWAAGIGAAAAIVGTITLHCFGLD